MKTQLEELRKAHGKAKSDKAKAKVDQKVRALAEANPAEFAETMVDMAKETKEEAKQLALRVKMQEVLPAISMSYVAKQYFGKTRYWLSQRLNGSIVNGKPAKMTPEEEKKLENALHDLGHKLLQTRLS